MLESVVSATEPHPVKGGEAAVLPVQLKALRLLGERLGLDVAAEARLRHGCEPDGLGKRAAAALIAELTQKVLALSWGAGPDYRQLFFIPGRGCAHEGGLDPGAGTSRASPFGRTKARYPMAHRLNVNGWQI